MLSTCAFYKGPNIYLNSFSKPDRDSLEWTVGDFEFKIYPFLYIIFMKLLKYNNNNNNNKIY